MGGSALGVGVEVEPITNEALQLPLAGLVDLMFAGFVVTQYGKRHGKQDGQQGETGEDEEVDHVF